MRCASRRSDSRSEPPSFESPYPIFITASRAVNRPVSQHGDFWTLGHTFRTSASRTPAILRVMSVDSRATQTFHTTPGTLVTWAPRLDVLGGAILRYGLVVILLYLGTFKFTS